MWHEGLEEVSCLYFGEHDLDGMVEQVRDATTLEQNTQYRVLEHRGVLEFLASHRSWK
jgi:hypothetical protein